VVFVLWCGVMSPQEKYVTCRMSKLFWNLSKKSLPYTQSTPASSCIQYRIRRLLYIHFISVYLCSQSSVKCVVSSSTIVVKNVFFSFFLRLFLLTLLTRRLTFFFTPEGCHTHRPQSHSRVVPYDHVRSYIVRFTYREWITHSSLPNCEVRFRISKINVFIEFEAFSILIL
jgi:hypothetical protein